MTQGTRAVVGLLSDASVLPTEGLEKEIDFPNHLVAVLPKIVHRYEVPCPWSFVICYLFFLVLTKMIRTGIGFDTHRLVEGRRLILGGVDIPHETGLLGHSDADVLAHAVMDALLGAVALGDIGQHFPDTDNRWKGADSLKLLDRVTELLRENGWKIVNVDATILAERPKMMPHLPKMRENLAARMGVPVGAVSVKATTVEGLGAIGRREGISVMAVATVESF